LGLIATANAYGAWIGTGWGRRYIELSDKYQIHDFELWPYIPHNSILGLLAYTGILGAAAFWFAFSTAMFMNARLGRQAPSPLARRIGIVGATQMIVCANQMYGDMGIFSSKTIYILAASYAVALRLPALEGVWPSRIRKFAAGGVSPAAEWPVSA
jgi:O-antigen ligase